MLEGMNFFDPPPSNPQKQSPGKRVGFNSPGVGQEAGGVLLSQIMLAVRECETKLENLGQRQQQLAVSQENLRNAVEQQTYLTRVVAKVMELNRGTKKTWPKMWQEGMEAVQKEIQAEARQNQAQPDQETADRIAKLEDVVGNMASSFGQAIVEMRDGQQTLLKQLQKVMQGPSLNEKLADVHGPLGDLEEEDWGEGNAPPEEEQ